MVARQNLLLCFGQFKPHIATENKSRVLRVAISKNKGAGKTRFADRGELQKENPGLLNRLLIYAIAGGFCPRVSSSSYNSCTSFFAAR